MSELIKPNGIEPLIDFKKRVGEIPFDPTKQEFTISTNKPLRCADTSCTQPITSDIPFLLLSVGDRGAIFMHALCMGINPNGKLDDPNWIAHVRRKFIDRFMTDKLYGRRD